MKNKKQRKKAIIISAVVIILAVIICVWLVPYLKRHYSVVEIDSKTAVAGEKVDTGGRKILTVYFTRLGNSDFEENVDAVSGASLMLDEENRLLGNSQVIAQMIQNAAGGDILPIKVKNKYPSAYSDTVVAAREEMQSDKLPELIDSQENLDEYDTIILVYPLWWGTIPKPVETFLCSCDFSGKTVIPVVTHGGSGAGSSVEDIKNLCGGTVTENPLEVYCDDVPYYRDKIGEWLKEIF